MNVSKKRKHIFFLEEFIHVTKMKFNNEIISLRDRKKAIIEKSNEYNARIKKINTDLNVNENLFTPSLDLSIEAPES